MTSLCPRYPNCSSVCMRLYTLVCNRGKACTSVCTIWTKYIGVSVNVVLLYFNPAILSLVYFVVPRLLLILAGHPSTLPVPKFRLCKPVVEQQ